MKNLKNLEQLKNLYLIICSARLLWTINKLNAISNNECYNFKAMCERVGMNYEKVSIFLDISNDIMNKNIDF
ncbi:MAG: hypothetical protein IJ086_13600 [Clostridium sp.]|nr:hypothetical protein [Clostridium sp.]